MLETPYFRTLFFLIIGIAAVHVAALKFAWYWTYPWLDLFVHFWGGFWVALLALWLVFFSGYFDLARRRYRTFFYTALAVTAVVALGWEVFEVKFNIMLIPDNYGRDTVSDVVLGLLGGFSASVYAYKGYREN